MINRPCLSLDDALLIAGAVVERATEMGEQVCVAVTDATTFVQCHFRMDGAGLFSMESSLDKAASAAEGLGVPTAMFEKFVLKGELSALKLPVTPIEGGEPVVVDGHCVGGVGVAGADLAVDTQLAQAGVAAFMATCAGRTAG